MTEISGKAQAVEMEENAVPQKLYKEGQSIGQRTVVKKRVDQ